MPGALATAILHYALTLGGVYVLAVIVNLLAPSFDGRKDQIHALKLVAYASTASWLSGVFSLIPGLGFLGLLGLYSLYLFYIGLPVLMKSPPEKTLPYTALIIVAAIVVGIVIAPLSALLIGMSIGTGAYMNSGPGGTISVAPGSYADGNSGGTLTLPGGATVQMGKLRQAGAALSAGTQGAGSTTPHLSSDTLKTFLPGTLLDDLPRTETSSAGGDVAGFGASSAEAKYEGGGRSVTLTVGDMGGFAALAGLTGVMGVNADQQTATSSSRVYQDGNRTIAEEYHSDSRSGSYAIIIAGRFMVKTEGTNVTLADLRGAAEGVDLGRLAALAK